VIDFTAGKTEKDITNAKIFLKKPYCKAAFSGLLLLKDKTPLAFGIAE